jgi:hypothetical protein
MFLSLSGVQDIRRSVNVCMVIIFTGSIAKITVWLYYTRYHNQREQNKQPKLMTDDKEYKMKYGQKPKIK